MQDTITHGGLRVASVLDQLVREQLTPGTGIKPDAVWGLLDTIVAELGPRNSALLARRDELQADIDQWLRSLAGAPIDGDAYRAFLNEIGYLVPQGDPFAVTTRNVDPEIATLAGPQLVVPVDKARYALNAANARWGSLYDALYGTDAIGEPPAGGAYDSERGQRVVDWANDFLDDTVPLTEGSWRDITAIKADQSEAVFEGQGGTSSKLREPSQFVGLRRNNGALCNLLLRNNGLHIDIVIDAAHPIGQSHPAGVCDVVVESAISTIMDCEDSVAAVDANDKAVVYANWGGIMRGDLSFTFTKNGQPVERRLNPDRFYDTPDGKPLVLPGRSLLLVRHVGAHVMTDAVTTADGEPIPETFLDCVLTTLAALHDLNATNELRNSREGSLYIVKPKQHGPDEVALSVELFARVEAGFGLAANTLKIGIMDEERRTTVNLAECIRVASERVIFINTGFLDRTGDEIHTHMQAGPVIPKAEIKSAAWMLAYENWNVDIGLATGLPGHGQVGKGMWAMPAQMQAMLETKIGHPQAGASCAWVPSPTAAALHVTHYHRVNVAEQQARLRAREPAKLADILQPPLLGSRQPDPATIQAELDNNAQGILGYVVRWVDQGIGCSTVPDINDVGLMEDRATLRISSQHIANWLLHGIVTRDDVEKALERMAVVVDRQNAGDDNYRAMAPDFAGSIAFQAARDLVFNGATEPNGYTESSLARRRREFKQTVNA